MYHTELESIFLRNSLPIITFNKEPHIRYTIGIEQKSLRFYEIIQITTAIQNKKLFIFKFSYTTSNPLFRSQKSLFKETLG